MGWGRLFPEILVIADYFLHTVCGVCMRIQCVGENVLFALSNNAVRKLKQVARWREGLAFSPPKVQMLQVISMKFHHGSSQDSPLSANLLFCTTALVAWQECPATPNTGVYKLLCTRIEPCVLCVWCERERERISVCLLQKKIINHYLK